MTGVTQESQQENETEVIEESIEIADGSCQTETTPSTSTGAQTEPPDDPPSYAESSPLIKPVETHRHFSLSSELESCNRRLLDACYSIPVTANILQRVPKDWHPLFINVLTAVLVLSSPAFLFGWTCGFAAARWYTTNILWLAVDSYESIPDVGPTTQFSFLLRE